MNWDKLLQYLPSPAQHLIILVVVAVAATVSYMNFQGRIAAAEIKAASIEKKADDQQEAIAGVQRDLSHIRTDMAVTAAKIENIQKQQDEANRKLDAILTRVRQ